MQTITSLEQLDLNGFYSYADYLRWQFSERVELIKGKIFHMSPAPSRKHQEVVTHFLRILLHTIPVGKDCKVYTAPFDVRLVKNPQGTSDKEVYSVVQPDLCVICDRSKLDERGCIGAPDLIVEILSKGNSKKEVETKYALYQENGVREYWIVFPYEEVVQQHVLDDNGCYRLHNMYSGDSVATSVIFPQLSFQVAEIFED